MGKVVEISPTTRHEGRSKLVLQVDDEGIITVGNWISVTPVRGLEKAVLGKPMEQVPKLLSRVCGICPVAHALAAVEAIETSIGVEIPADAHTLRVILHCANRLNNHALSNIFTLPDLYIPGTDRKINLFSPEEPMRSIARRIQRIREIAQGITEIAGGEAIHPTNTRIGGMYYNITSRAKQKLTDLAKEAVDIVKTQMDFMIAVLRNFQRRDWTEIGGRQIPIPRNLGYHSEGYLATDSLYGTSSRTSVQSWDPDHLREIRPWNFYMGEVTIDLEDSTYPIGGTTAAGTVVHPKREATNAIPLYNGRPVEVGPRARMALYQGFNEKGTIGQQVARQMEYITDVDEILNRLDMLNTSGKVLTDPIPPGDGKTLAWATTEPARGTNVHFVRVREGKVADYSMIVPTTWNFPVCSKALSGAPWQLAEVIIRGYDPCVSCATHMIVLDPDKNVVAQNLIR